MENMTRLRFRLFYFRSDHYTLLGSHVAFVRAAAIAAGLRNALT